MNNKFDQFIGDSKALKLNAEEKKDVRSALKMHMAKDAISLSAEEKLESKHFLQMFMRRIPKRSHWLHLSLKSCTAAFAMIALFSGSLAYAAEDTVPGDTLYPLKVDVFEPMRGRMQLTPESKAQWNARRIERRLEESQRLMGRGDKDFSTHLPQIQQRLAEHTTHLQQRLADLESDERAEDIREKIENTLLRHEEMLSNIESGELDEEKMHQFTEYIRKDREKIHGWKRPEKMPPSDLLFERKPVMPSGTEHQEMMREQPPALQRREPPIPQRREAPPQRRPYMQNVR